MNVVDVVNGLSNILEKSLGAVAKGGTSPLIDVYEFAERVTAAGCTFMNTPCYDPVSLTGLAAGGCNLIAFTTGRGKRHRIPHDPGAQDRHQQPHLPHHDG